MFPLEYLATRQSVSDGASSGIQGDQLGNLRQTMETYLGALGDSVTAWPKGMTATVLTASGLCQTGAGMIIGYHINSHTATASLRFSDAITATTPYLGAAVVTTAGTLAGTFTQFPASVATGVYVTITGTMDVTIFTLAQPTN